jgi:hypothetical protein
MFCMSATLLNPHICHIVNSERMWRNEIIEWIPFRLRKHPHEIELRTTSGQRIHLGKGACVNGFWYVFSYLSAFGRSCLLICWRQGFNIFCFEAQSDFIAQAGQEFAMLPKLASNVWLSFLHPTNAEEFLSYWPHKISVLL